MALQFGTTLRNNFLSQLPSATDKIKVWTGAEPANCAAADTGTLLVEYDLAGAGDWGSPSSGSITLSGLTLTTTASNTGTAGYFRMYDSGAVCFMQGTCSATGGGGDLQFDNTSITSGQTVNLTGFTITAPGA